MAAATAAPPAAPGVVAPPPSSPPPPPAPPGPPPGPSPAVVAFNKVVSTLRSRYGTDELLGLAGGLIILGVFLIFGVLAGSYYPGELQVLLAATLLLVIVAHRQGLWDFGNAYQTAILLLGLLLGVLLVYELLQSARQNLFSALSGLSLLGLFLTWIGEALAAGAAILVWQRRRA